MSGTADRPARWPRLLEGVLLLAVAALPALLAQRAATGHTINDILRGLLASALLWALMPLLWRHDGLRAWRRRALRALAHVHAAAYGRPVAFALAATGLWLVTHAVYSATLADPGYGYDLRIGIQAAADAIDPRGPMWLTIDDRGQGAIEQGATSFLAQHWEPYLYALRPLTWLPLPSFWFAAVQDLAQGLFLYLALLVLRARAPGPGARLVCLLCLLANPFWAGLIHYEQHEYGFVPALGLLAWLAWQRRSMLGFALAVLALLSLKETVSISMAWLGLVLVAEGIRTRSRWSLATGTVALACGLATYVVYFKVVLPAVSGGRTWSAYGGYYQHLGTDAVHVALAPFLRPAAFWAAVVAPGARLWLTTWFLAVGGVGFLGWRWWLLIVPELAIIWLADNNFIQLTVFQYGGLLLPVAVLAMADGWALVARRWSGRPRAVLTALAAAALASALVARSPVPQRICGLLGPDGLAALPFALRVPAGEPLATNTSAAAMHAAARRVVICRSALNGTPADGHELVVTPDVRWYLLHDDFRCTGRERLREVARHGPWALCRLDDGR